MSKKKGKKGKGGTKKRGKKGSEFDLIGKEAGIYGHIDLTDTLSKLQTQSNSLKEDNNAHRAVWSNL